MLLWISPSCWFRLFVVSHSVSSNGLMRPLPPQVRICNCCPQFFWCTSGDTLWIYIGHYTCNCYRMEFNKNGDPKAGSLADLINSIIVSTLKVDQDTFHIFCSFRIYYHHNIVSPSIIDRPKNTIIIRIELN